MERTSSLSVQSVKIHMVEFQPATVLVKYRKSRAGDIFVVIDANPFCN